VKGLVFLDFDGVICDSLPETLVSSWRAYYLLRKETEPSSVPVTLLRDFKRFRPYVRAGEDFILIHELIQTGASIRSQEAFDAELARAGERQIEHYKEAFYSARRDFLVNHRDYWISLNRIYAHSYDCLRKWSSSPSLYILSTKRASYIVEILTAKGIDMEPAHVLSCEAKEKKTTILHTLEARGADQALFIDDQIDHLASDWTRCARHPQILGCLAAWGYVQQQWLEDPRGIEVIQPGQLAGRLASWLDG
jgi:phosphoglycolate phosphatase-like HAD superfamily hydrolase